MLPSTRTRALKKDKYTPSPRIPPVTRLFPTGLDRIDGEGGVRASEHFRTRYMAEGLSGDKRLFPCIVSQEHQEPEMKLYEHLKEEFVCIDLKSREKRGLITELAELLRNHPAMVDFDEFLKAVFSRESDSTTGIGGGVAIPHARTDSVRDLVGAVGVSRYGVDFQSVDGEPVNLVILMGIPAHKVNAYLKLLAHLSLLLKQGDFVEQVLSSPTPDDLLKTITRHEE